MGERKDSQTYVNMKKKAAAEVGFHSVVRELPAEVSQAELEAEVKSLNDDPAVHAILVQLPLPEGIDEEAVLAAISLGKVRSATPRSAVCAVVTAAADADADAWGRGRMWTDSTRSTWAGSA